MFLFRFIIEEIYLSNKNQNWSDKWIIFHQNFNISIFLWSTEKNWQLITANVVITIMMMMMMMIIIVISVIII